MTSPDCDTYLVAVTYTATVTGSSGTPTGSVTFTINGNTPVTMPLSSGVATFNWTFLNAGVRTVTATYLADANNAGSTSATLSQTVNSQTTQTTLTSSLNPSVMNQAVTYRWAPTVKISSAYSQTNRSFLLPAGAMTKARKLAD